VYLPEGEWIDYWTGERLTGGQHILAHAPLAVMPIYVRDGAVIPELVDEECKPTLDEQAQVVLAIHRGQTGQRSVGRWYEDDARTYAYDKQEYNLLEVSSLFEQDKVTLDMRYVSKGLPNERKTLDIELRGMTFVPQQLF